MASERSCSVTMSDRRVFSRYSRFVTMLGGAGTSAPTFRDFVLRLELLHFLGFRHFLGIFGKV